MARTIQVGGYTTGVPGSYQNSIQRSAPSQPGTLETGRVAILGECEGEIKPNTPARFRLGAGAYLKKQLVKGQLYDAARFAFKPSRNDPNEVRGASEVLAMRVNQALQAALVLKSAAPANLINLTTKGYGIAQNGIAAQVAAGGNGAYGKKVTITRPGYVDEVKDDLGRLPAFIIRYTGSGTDAAMTISRTALTTSITGASGDNLSLSFATYDTVQKLVDAINATGKYEAIIVTTKPDTFKCEDLDFVTGADIKLVDSGTVTIGDTTTTNMTLASVDAGNVVRLGAGVEYVYITSTGSPNTVIRGFLDSTPAAHSGVDADEFYGVTGINKAIIDWANASSQHVSAARHTDYAVGVPNTLAKTYFTGGSEGTASTTDYENALKELKKHHVNLIVVLSSSSAVHAKFKEHMTWRWGKGGMECVGHCAAAKEETYSQIKTRAKALQDANIAIWFQHVTRDDDQGISTTYDPWAMATLGAGIQAGTPFGEGLEYKTLDVGELGQNSAIDLEGTAIEDCVEDGISVANYWDDEWRVVRCLSTWTQNDDHEKIEMNVRRSLAHTLVKTRLRVKADFLGKAVAKNNAQSVKSSLRSALEDLRDKDKSIVEGSKEVNGRRANVPAFEIYPVEQNGNVVGYSYECVPTGSSTFLVGDTFVGEFTDVA